jgi:BirA family biotin operon repressor/biotin-[acetyl-CoA-carboxylase] ligase
MPQNIHFDLVQLEATIAGTEFAGYLMHFPTVGSTNDLALQAAQHGARHGVWIADQQTAGRGRGSHGWHSAPGEGLYLTALITPPIPLQAALSLSFSTAIAVQAAIASITGFRIPEEIDIRWPNDLMLTGKDGKVRKCGGILIETAAQPAPASGWAMLRYGVIGIGVNCNHVVFPPELDGIATSLRRELPEQAEPIRRELLAGAILLALDAELRSLTAENEPRANNVDLTRYSTWIFGKRVRVEARDGDPGYTGTTAGLDANGFLRVTGDDGQAHAVRSGGLREP